MPLVPPQPEVAKEDVHEQGLHHQLTVGQMTMVAVGGSIGTGLLLGSAAALEVAGPSVILSYIIAAFIAYTVAMALGELASTHPAAGSFGVYGELYLNQYLGFLCRAGYWAAIAFSIGAELTASATYMAYWLPAVPGEIWVIVFSALLLLVNLRSVLAYGRFEFWFAMIKFVTIVAFILAGAVLLLQGTEDAVVPPSQAERMRDALVAAGTPCDLRFFEGEGHGFRRADTLTACLEAELAFYLEVLHL